MLEHDSQYVCSACLIRLKPPAFAKQPGITNYASKVSLAALGAISFVGMWFAFYLVGEWMLRLKLG